MWVWVRGRGWEGGRECVYVQTCGGPNMVLCTEDIGYVLKLFLLHPVHIDWRLKTCYEEAAGDRVSWVEMCALYNGYCTKLGKMGTVNSTGFLTLAK